MAQIGAPATAILLVLSSAWIGTLLLAPTPPAGADAAEHLRFWGEHDGWLIASFAFTVPLGLVHVPVWLALAALCWPNRPAAALLAVAFGLLYAPLTVWAYWTQLTTVRGMANLQHAAPAEAVAAYRVVGFRDDLWSATYGAAVLGYAIWGLGALAVAAGLMSTGDRLARVTAGLFGLAGTFGLVGALGFVTRLRLLEAGVLASGVVFLPAAATATILLWRGGRDRPNAAAGSA